MTQTNSRFPVWAALLGSGLAGMLVAVQSRVNGGLSREIDNGFLAALVSFGSGLVIIGLILLCTPSARRGLSQLARTVRAGELPVWGLLGGTCGGFFVLSQGLVAPALGLALFTVGIVAGQVSGGLVMDRIGLGPGGRVDPTPARVIGTVLAVVAVAFTVWADLRPGSPVWLVLVPIVAGLGMAWQSAVNGLVRSAAHSAITATFINFVTGTAMLGIAAAISLAVRGWPTHWPSEPWFYVGGLIGTLFIAVAAVLVRTAGVLLLSMSNVAGQLIASVALEAGLPLANGVTPGLIAGAAVSLIAVAIAAGGGVGRAKRTGR
ncbi:DMT family transporter [Leucobacter iarius]|uniref:Transporter family-2 protein n=1 Tax=Leucobacter iarius TaxID=333963 RepID=A0ABN2LAC1_9MICO